MTALSTIDLSSFMLGLISGVAVGFFGVLIAVEIYVRWHRP
jgi:hypothetical protein